MPVFDLARAVWRKSSHSGGYEGGSNCVEVTSSRDLVAVRDSKDPGRRTLIFGGPEWRAFVSGLKGSHF